MQAQAAYNYIESSLGLGSVGWDGSEDRSEELTVGDSRTASQA